MLSLLYQVQMIDNIYLFLPSSRQGISSFRSTFAEQVDHNVSPDVPLLGDIMYPCLGQEFLPFPDRFPS